jgi:hypothetical protein
MTAHNGALISPNQNFSFYTTEKIRLNHKEAAGNFSPTLL